MTRVLVVLVALALALGASLFVFDRLVEPAPASANPDEEKFYLPEIAPVGATLLDGLGNYSRSITTDNSEVQRWFDQALMLTWGLD